MTAELPRIIGLIGLPASGKTTWAQRWIAEHPEYVRVSNEELTLRQYGKLVAEEPVEHALIRALRSRAIRDAIANGRSVVVDNCNLGPKPVRELATLAHQLGVSLHWQSFLSVPWHDCVLRDAERGSKVGGAEIRRMAENFGLKSRKPVTR